ncbi:MAG: translation elongation factor Ts, partial [bacterium]
EVADGAVQAYVHHDNKKGALVQVTSDKPDLEVMRDLCMHIVVFSPASLDRSEIDESLVEREKAIIMEELSGKPAEIQEKIMGGRLEKFYAGQVITEQPWVKDDKQTVQKVLQATMGDGAQLTGFTRFEVGA